jgi:hypothetical protein
MFVQARLPLGYVILSLLTSHIKYSFCSRKLTKRLENVKRHFKKSGHCPELLIDDSPEQLAYKKAAAEEARKDPLPRKSQSRVKNSQTPRGSEGEESL